ncbi:asparagine synthase (glutamine-hydrolyzing) [Alteromonas oceanisediminis]|uniref:asparagine synthase (glutamine-hydrolyzing) n=1 Tax=Alteromonas oceanisediminis TaxID=2836180 RepID=UPI001BDA5991|nr:asparagine synthase (glutamine-hydrolyzing) [Alteromonas oceanisediminis]MBT0584939.1 asparagine synthase (glutamine-hydrolyzing) [Alteromonas oceanisediminis]
MCAIVGVINFNKQPVSSVVVARMRDSMSHRGPDDSGVWTENNVSFGHRRLTILDLSSSGHQPMSSHDGRYILTYNGEVYNFRELRAELEGVGVKFRSNCDSEVVLYSLIHWGHHAVKRFNGMFAFCFFDRQTGDTLLARDRYGIKPLYLYSGRGIFSFSSEQRAFFELPSFKKVIKKSSLKQYFTFQNILTNDTLLEGVQILKPGYYLQFNANDEVFRPCFSQYWDFTFSEADGSFSSKQEYVEETNRLLVQAVNRQLVSDVELGSFLSGGIDSGLIAGIASESCPYLKTFTCGFDMSSATGLEQAFDERKVAEHLSYLFKTEQYEMVLKAGDMQRSLSKLAYHLEEPRVGQCYPNLYAAKLASKFVKVCLSGVGGDEIFAGYPWRYRTLKGLKNFSDFESAYFSQWERLCTGASVDSLLAPIANDTADCDLRSIFSKVFDSQGSQDSSETDLINRALYFDAKTFLPGLLHVEDKLSMSFGLEVRVPFLDNDLVDFAMHCPLQHKVDINAAKVNRSGKKVLRACAEKYMPKSIANARKQGFSAPDASWFKGESIQFVKNQLLNDNAPVFEFVDRDVAHRLVNEHVNGEKNHRLLIWSLLNMSEYIHQTFDHKPRVSNV